MLFDMWAVKFLEDLKWKHMSSSLFFPSSIGFDNKKSRSKGSELPARRFLEQEKKRRNLYDSLIQLKRILETVSILSPKSRLHQHPIHLDTNASKISEQ